MPDAPACRHANAAETLMSANNADGGGEPTGAFFFRCLPMVHLFFQLKAHPQRCFVNSSVNIVFPFIFRTPHRIQIKRFQ